MMIRILLVIILNAVVLFSNHAQENVQTLERHWKPNVEKVQIISYNIFNGFDWGKDTERKERFIDWVKSRDPEV